MEHTQTVLLLLLMIEICGACKTGNDCNMAGRCVSAAGVMACKCDSGWTGEHCERISFGMSQRCGSGGLCLDGSSADGGFKSTWGGEAVRADDGKYHVYAAGFPNNRTLNAWLTASRVVHGVSKNAAGPYVFRDIALGERSLGYWDGLTQHNPAVQRAPDGTYLLYYMGSTQSTPAPQGYHGVAACANATRAGVNVSACRQRVGLATASSPNGPWTRRESPIVDVASEASAWDSLFTTNPTPHVFANGSVLLLYKARSVANPNTMSTGAAFAEHWSGPYQRMVSTPIAVPGTCEDAGIYYSEQMQVFRMILHCGCAYQSVWSLDGIDWHRTAPLVPWCNVSLGSGRFEQLERRERPKWLIDSESGAPVGLFTGVAPPALDHDGDTYTMYTEIFTGDAP